MRVLINAFYCSPSACRSPEVAGWKDGEMSFQLVWRTGRKWTIEFRATLFYFIEFFAASASAYFVATSFRWSFKLFLFVQRRRVEYSSAHAWDNSWIKLHCVFVQYSAINLRYFLKFTFCFFLLATFAWHKWKHGKYFVRPITRNPFEAFRTWISIKSNSFIIVITLIFMGCLNFPRLLRPLKRRF